MKMETNSIDYGIYIDREKAFVIALDNAIHEILISDTTIERSDADTDNKHVSQQEHVQNRQAESRKKFCKSIIGHITNANSIIVFGPSTTKFELHNELEENKRLKQVKKEIETTDFMDHGAAMQFVKDHFTPVTAGQQIFTGRRH